MNIELESHKKLIDLQKFFADSIKTKWPESDIDKEIEKSISSLKNIFEVHLEDYDLNDNRTIKELQVLVNRYISNTNTMISDYHASLISCYYGKLLDQTVKKGKSLLQIEEEEKNQKYLSIFNNRKNHKQIGENLLYLYLNQYSEVSKTFKQLLKDLFDLPNLFFDRSEVIKKFRTSVSFAEQLANLEISPRFIYTKYLLDFYFSWTIGYADLKSEKTLNIIFSNNEITKFSQDQAKIICAKAAFDISRASLKEDVKNHLFASYLLPFIGVDSPLNESFWKVEESLQDDFSLYLNKAPDIFREFYTSDFIGIFFDALIAAGGGDPGRAAFWKQYKGEVKYLYFALNNKHQQCISNYIQKNRGMNVYKNYSKIMNNSLLKIQSNAVNTSAVMIFVFERIIITEFSNTGFIYFYENTLQNRRNIIGNNYPRSDRDFKDPDLLYAFNKKKHSENWMYDTILVLNNYGIRI